MSDDRRLCLGAYHRGQKRWCHRYIGCFTERKARIGDHSRKALYAAEVTHRRLIHVRRWIDTGGESGNVSVTVLSCTISLAFQIGTGVVSHRGAIKTYK